MAVRILNSRFSRAFGRCRHNALPKRYARSCRCSSSVVSARLSRGSRRVPRVLRAVENRKEKLPELSLFKQLEKELETLGDALVKIHKSKTTGTSEDETLLTMLIEEVQHEQEAWYKQVQVMEKLVAQAANLDTGEMELDELRKKYEEMRRKVELYNGLLSEREREVDSLKQQLEDVSTAAELKELKAASLKELVAAGSNDATQDELRLPAWSTEAVSNFFVKKDDVIDVTPKKASKKAPKNKKNEKSLKRMEIPGLALVSLVSVATDISSEAWKQGSAKLPRELKASVEIVMLCLIFAVGAKVVVSGLL